jgi:Rrf2 family protein
MNLTKRGEYALRTLIRLGVAHEVGRELLTVSDIAEAERLPLKYAEQILQQLRGAGWVETKRGKFGGYRLAMPMKEIKLGAVIRRIDGRLAPLACASETSYEPCSCPDEEHCGLRMLMIDVRNAIANILDRYSLADVVEVTLRKLRRDGVPITFETAFRPVVARPERARNADPADGIYALLRGDNT